MNDSGWRHPGLWLTAPNVNRNIARLTPKDLLLQPNLGGGFRTA